MSKLFHIWWIYQPLMKLAHRFNWHHMPPCYPEGDTMIVCHWCGARYIIPKKSASALRRGSE